MVYLIFCVGLPPLGVETNSFYFQLENFESHFWILKFLYLRKTRFQNFSK